MVSVLFDGDKVDLQEVLDALSTKLKSLQTTMDETIAYRMIELDKTNTGRSPMDLTLLGETASRPCFNLVSNIHNFDGGRADLVTPFRQQRKHWRA